MRQLKITQSLTNRDSSTVEKYFNEVSKAELLTPDEEAILARKVREGDEAALERLVKANLRFVISVAKQYHYGDIPLNDLINEGNIGLIKAAQKFDETKGFKFISYAVWWIRQSILDALSKNGRFVRLPLHKIMERSKIKQFSSKFEQKFEREPTPEEVAEHVDCKPQEVVDLNPIGDKPASLQAEFDDGEGCMLDILKHSSSSNPDQDLMFDSVRKDIERILKKLSDREREVILRFFGLGREYSESLEDIAATMGLTKERVRQLKECALRKLRSGVKPELLTAYL
jgi:RNA polymerase primary sigma factor